MIQALLQLTERQRAMVVLHHIADRPVAEIATMFGVTSGTVTATLHQARTNLARHLDPDARPEPLPAPTPIDGALP